MTKGDMIVGGIYATCLGAFLGIGALGAKLGYDQGYSDGVKHGRADADRRVRVARAECHALIENQRAWYEGLHDRAAVIWETNTRALLADMVHYEEDLERCHGRR